MSLGRRLEAILINAENSGTLLDVGCDHAYLSIEAVRRGLAEKAIASDVNEGPLKKAEENIKKAGLSERISIRLGSGTAVIKEREADTVVIAGMGGILISGILLENPPLSRSVKSYILQPMNNTEALRRFLIENGYCIVSETLAEERGKIYSILKVIPEEQDIFEKEIFYHTGNLLRLRHTEKELALKYIDKTICKFKKIKESLKSARIMNVGQADYIAELLEESEWLRSEILKS